MSLYEVYAFLSRGGWLMVPIAACSVAGTAFFLERLWRLRRSRVLPDEFVSRLLELLGEGELERARELCRQTDSPLGPMVVSALEQPGAPREMLKERVEEVGQRQAFELERFVGALGAIATISPLLGLLGTVVGMIDVFQDVVAQSSAGGDVQAAALATGIWQALITTATGLTVAIPVYLAYRYLLSRVDQFAVDLEECALEAIDRLLVGREGGEVGEVDGDEEGGDERRETDGGTGGESEGDEREESPETDPDREPDEQEDGSTADPAAEEVA